MKGEITLEQAKKMDASIIEARLSSHGLNITNGFNGTLNGVRASLEKSLDPREKA